MQMEGRVDDMAGDYLDTLVTVESTLGKERPEDIFDGLPGRLRYNRPPEGLRRALEQVAPVARVENEMTERGEAVCEELDVLAQRGSKFSEVDLTKAGAFPTYAAF